MPRGIRRSTQATLHAAGQLQCLLVSLNPSTREASASDGPARSVGNVRHECLGICTTGTALVLCTGEKRAQRNGRPLRMEALLQRKFRLIE